MYIMPGSTWENEFVESVNGTMARELLNREILIRYMGQKIVQIRLRKLPLSGKLRR
ncbi:integrase core domain-containing protein [Oscillibacter sp.]|uniref:integrase core domain-containing protein n=1 Tax=Oscillibacter sp. TaxID=1945593 RepID=UPI0037CB3608